MREPTQLEFGEGRCRVGSERPAPTVPPGEWRRHACTWRWHETRETPAVRGRGSQRELREEQARSCGVADRLVLLWKPGNAGGGKEPDFWRVTGRDQQSGDWLCLSTPLKTKRSRKELYLPAKMARLAGSRPLRGKAIVCCREKPVGEPCAGNSHARFDEREVETEHGAASEAPADERAGHR